ncbi:MAG TPA: DUF6089 family protein [Segetibacter sp.]
MKNGSFLIFGFLFLSLCSFAQPLRIHIMGGFANYGGDLQSKSFTLHQAKGVVTAGATFNITEQLAVRSEYSFGSVGADDKKTTNQRVIGRNLNFKTLIQDFSLMGEYDIFNLYDHRITPFVFGGIGVFQFSPFTTTEAGKIVYLHELSTEGQGILPGRKLYKKTQFNIPIGGGLKYALSDDIHLGLELGFKMLTTDYLDDVSATYVDQNLLLSQRGPLAVQLAFRGDELKQQPGSYPAGGSMRGNSKVNDYYYFGQLRISFRMNWFNIGDNKISTGLKRLGCPGKF